MGKRARQAQNAEAAAQRPPAPDPAPKPAPKPAQDAATKDKAAKPTNASGLGELDALFAAAGSQVRKNKQQARADAADAERRAEEERREAKKRRREQRDSAYADPKPVRFDAELGLPIYTEESLRIGQGKGDTADCPFDCSCCF